MPLGNSFQQLILYSQITLYYTHSFVSWLIFELFLLLKNIITFMSWMMKNAHVDLTDTYSHITFLSYPQLNRWVNAKEWPWAMYGTDYLKPCLDVSVIWIDKCTGKPWCSRSGQLPVSQNWHGVAPGSRTWDLFKDCSRPGWDPAAKGRNTVVQIPPSHPTFWASFWSNFYFQL